MEEGKYGMRIKCKEVFKQISKRGAINGLCRGEEWWERYIHFH